MATAGEIVRLALHYTQPGGGDMMNVFHFKLGGSVGTDATVVNGLAEWITFEWAARWKLRAASSCKISHFDADVMNTDGTVVRNLGGDIVDIIGNLGEQVLPAGTAGYLLAYTTIPKARGSKYVPGVAEIDSDGGVLTTNYIANLALLLAIYLNPYTTTIGLTLSPGLLSKTLETFIPFLISGAIDALVAYQRRRKVGVGI